MSFAATTHTAEGLCVSALPFSVRDGTEIYFAHGNISKIQIYKDVVV
jgi:hypothetical protein